MDCLTLLTNLSSIATCVFLVLGYNEGRKQAIAHLEAHMSILESWCAGPEGRGWTDDAVTAAHKLDWIDPGFSVVPQFSAGRIADLGLLQNVFISRELVPLIANVTQTLEAFNFRLGQIEAFKQADIRFYLAVSQHLHDAMEVVLGGADPALRAAASKEQFYEVIRLAKLGEDERRWVKAVGGQYASLHVQLIGTVQSDGLARHVAILRSAMKRVL